MTDSSNKNIVLVLDDDVFQHELVSCQLGKHNLEAICFLDGGEALSYLDHHQNHRDMLILVDLEMPQMDGVEFVRHLTERGFTGAIALMSGQDKRIVESAARLAMAHKLKFTGCLDKPVLNDSLAAVLDHWRRNDSGIFRKKHKIYGPEEIRRALSNNEFVNYYQPQVDLRTGLVSGVESLVRWQHPTDHLVFPDQFIGVAEEHELIEDLTRVVLGDALNQTRRWHDQGTVFRIAVNVSMEDLKWVDFPDHVQSEVQRTGLDPKCLVLEVTESRLTLDERLPLDILTRLRLKHFSLSIDDFGTGHSSLAQLRDMPFDELKIDRSFVHGAGTNSTLRGIVEANLTLAASLGMSVVAEGIENREDWDFLRDHGCDLAQGYFIAKPMPAADIPAWLGQWETRGKALVPP